LQVCFFHIDCAINFGAAFDSNGVDVYFLNRPKVMNIRSGNQLDNVFAREPTDYDLTPLSQKVSLILNEKRGAFLAGNCVLVIATDGAPMSSDGTDSVSNFTQVLRDRHRTVGSQSAAQLPITIRACTNDQSAVGYLNKLDNDTKLYIDVVDDYASESLEIRTQQGREFGFSYGDYILKTLMASFDPWMDKIDEPKSFTTAEVNYQKYGELPPPGYNPEQGKKKKDKCNNQ
jgi:hypothetical protein